MAEKSGGANALDSKQLEHPNSLGSHAARKMDGATERKIEGRHVSVQQVLVLPGLLTATVSTGLRRKLTRKIKEIIFLISSLAFVHLSTLTNPSARAHSVTPRFQFEPSTSELTLKPSVVAQGVALHYRQQQATSPWQVLSAERVSKEERAQVVGTGEEPKAQAVLAEHHLQFGQYRGHTFRWLLENDVGFACSIIASHEKERASGDTSQMPLMSNKDALAFYARLFPP
ncbi:hypothetical protein ACEWY4_022369 [Coilia grayii]|uniref:Uncharacterized protein n=1 Tax=Coilia grayii TaxID=363190 RepID=A0ABD1J948_9TELE